MLTHLERLEAESIHIMREVVAESENPVMLYSIGKDSSVMLHLAMKAFYPAKPPFPLLHVDTTWKFREMIAFRDETAARLGLDLRVHINPEGVANGIDPFTHGSAVHTDVWKTQGPSRRSIITASTPRSAARAATRRSRARRSASCRCARNSTAGTRSASAPVSGRCTTRASARAKACACSRSPTGPELDIWQYIQLHDIPIVPLYFAKERPVVERDGALIMVDDERLPLREGEVPQMRKVRFRTLGCYPLTGAIDSDATSLDDILQEMRETRTSERQGRLIDSDSAGSMEKKKQEGYF